ncbi:MAG: 30S ribosomal protein S11 [Gammaproteobacteria bacterium]|nr:30S ribosomal protein S11 [Gammaproteobacteria bacterium]
MARKSKRQVTDGVVYIKATFNNTLINITDWHGGTLVWASAASCGFRGSRKSTPFAAQTAAGEAGKNAIDNYGLRQAIIKVCGPGPGRESAARAIEAAGIKILAIEDVTGIPHNGCRRKKKRRV